MSVKLALHALIGFLALIGAMAMLIFGSPHNALVVSNSVETEPEPGVGLTSHVTSGRNASKVTRHATSGEYATQDVLHDTSGGGGTQLVPPDWIHTKVSGTGETTGGFSAASGYDPPDSVHADVGPDISIYYNPERYRHASVDGPDVTHLVPRDFVHQSNRDLARYSEYVPPNIPIHVDTGPSATEDVFPGAGHYEDGPRASEYGNPGNGYHLSGGSFASGYSSVISHITGGLKASQNVSPIEHENSGQNVTSYIPFVPDPPPSPTPSPSPPPSN